MAAMLVSSVVLLLLFGDVLLLLQQELPDAGGVGVCLLPRTYSSLLIVSYFCSTAVVFVPLALLLDL